MHTARVSLESRLGTSLALSRVRALGLSPSVSRAPPARAPPPAGPGLYGSTLGSANSNTALRISQLAPLHLSSHAPRPTATCPAHDSPEPSVSVAALVREPAGRTGGDHGQISSLHASDFHMRFSGCSLSRRSFPAEELGGRGGYAVVTPATNPSSWVPAPTFALWAR